MNGVKTCCMVPTSAVVRNEIGLPIGRFRLSAYCEQIPALDVKPQKRIEPLGLPSSGNLPSSEGPIRPRQRPRPDQQIRSRGADDVVYPEPAGFGGPDLGLENRRPHKPEPENRIEHIGGLKTAPDISLLTRTLSMPAKRGRFFPGASRAAGWG
jgi:hypothetical protein